MRLTDDCPIAPTLPITIVVTASTASAGAHSCRRADQRHVEQPQQDPERRRLRRHRHERGDRRRRALVDVRRPLVERRDRRLEREAGDDQRERGQEQRVVAHLADRVRDRGEVGRAGRAVEQREPVEQHRRAERADDQVLEARLERVLAPQLGRAQHVERDREQLEADEQRDEVRRAREHDHPEHGEQQQRVVLAVARLGRRQRARRQQHRRHAGEHEDHQQREREVVDRERARHHRRVLAPLPDAEPGRDAERRHREAGHERGAHEGGAQQARPSARGRRRR